MSVTRRPRVLIAGGGWVGMHAALALERSLAPEEADLELVSPENFMLYQPLLPEVASGELEPRHGVVPLRRVLRRTHVTLGRVTGLGLGGRTATVEPATGDARDTAYDALIVGLGSVTKMLPVPGLVEHAVGFQTLSEAIHLRNQVLSRLEIAESATHGDARRRALTFVFVGAGYAGLEALAELQALAHQACGSYRTVRPEDLRWLLVEATERILPSVDISLARRAETLLRSRGIDIRLNTTLDSVEDGKLCLSDGERLEADTLVWMPGVVPNPEIARLGLPCDHQGRLQVDSCLRISGVERGWGAGDCAAVPDGSGGHYPPTAQHAEREARHLAANVAATLRGQSPAPFRYRSKGEFVTLGHRRAIASTFGVPLTGFPAWILRRAYYLARMPTAERRVRLLVDWLAGLPFEPDIAQLGAEQHPDRPLVDATSSG